MSSLSKAKKPEMGPFIGTIAGNPGTGKTSLGCLFPNPIVMQAEEGLDRVEDSIRAVGVEVNTVQEVFGMVKDLVTEDHDYKTLVVDTTTALDGIFADYVVSLDRNDPEKSNPSSINQAAGGYGNGPKAVGALHSSFVKKCFALQKAKGMNIVFIAHADTITVDLPDKDPYMIYSLRLLKHSVGPYVDEMKFVGFTSIATFLKGGSKEGATIVKPKKARTNGDRLLDCVTSGHSIAKNGYQIKDILEYEEGVNPLVGLVPGL